MTEQENPGVSGGGGAGSGISKGSGSEVKKQYQYCIIHCSSEDKSAKLLSPNSYDSWKTLLNAATVRCHQPLLEIAKQLKEGEVPAIHYHRKCRSVFTMKRDLDSIAEKEQGANDGEPPAKRRSIRSEPAQSRVYEKTCIFCLKNSKYLKGTRTREPLTLCAELRADRHVRKAAEDKCDDRILAMTSRDMVAAEAHYHRSCYKDYTRDVILSTTDISTDAKPEDAQYSCIERQAYDNLFEFIRTDLFQTPRVLKLAYLTSKVVSWMTSSGIEAIRDSTKKHIHWKIETEFGESLQIIQTAKGKLLIFPSDLSVRDVAEENIRFPDELETIKSDMSKKSEIVSKAGLLLHSSIKEYQESHEMNWPPDPSKTDKDHITIPGFLTDFLQIILTGERSALSQRVQWLVTSIGQDLLYGATRGKITPPKHILLPSAVKSLTGNVEVIKILNRFGHGVSYSHLSEIDTGLCLQKLAMISVTGIPLPQTIIPYVHTTLAYDNIDRLEETLSGGGTSHRINGIAVQLRVYGPQLPREIPEIAKGKQRSLAHFVDDLHLPVYNAGEKVGPPVRHNIVNIDFTEVQKEAMKKDMLWLLCKMHAHVNQKISSWTGFNILVQDATNVTENNIGYLPSINAPASNLSTVFEILSQANKIRQELRVESIACVFDQALYAKATEIKWKNLDLFGCIVLRMGAFHTTCTLLSIIGKWFQDAGLKDLCIETGVVAEGSVSAVLEGRMYNRGVRLHKLMYEALMRLAWQGFTPWIETYHAEERHIIEEAGEVIGDMCENVCHDTYTNIANNAVYLRLVDLFEMYLDYLRKDHGSLSSFWMSYIDLVEIMLQLIRASREKNWSLHLSAIHNMIPWCFAYDRHNYARYLPAYYADMAALPTEHLSVHAYMEQVGFAVQVGSSSSNPFGTIPVDQALEETINRDTQTPGGTKGFSLNPAAIQKHYLTSEYRSTFLSNLRDMIGLSSAQFHHADLSKPRIEEDEADVKAIVDMLLNNWINPFDENVTELVSLSTSAAATKEIVHDLLKAKEIGEKTYQEFKIQRLQGSDKKFHDRIPRQNLKTFSNLKKKDKNIKVHGKETILRADRNLFGNMIITAQSRKLNMQDVLAHPLGPLPWALTTPEGFPRKTNKSALGRELEKNVHPAECISKSQACIVDGMAIVQKIHGDKKTFLNISDTVFSLVLKEGEGSKRIDVVFDVYRDISIKNTERVVRAGSGDVLTYKHIAAGTKVIQWRSFLNCASNKTNLIQFMVTQWKEKRCRDKLKEKIMYVTCGVDCFRLTADDVILIETLMSSQEEADTRILLHAAHIATFSYEAIVISSMDTDVRILCLAFCSQIPVPMYQKCGTEARTKYVDICKMAQALGSDMCNSLLGLHAFTGCDMVSSFAGKGKLSAFKITKNDPMYQRMFQKLGESWEISTDLFEQLQSFVCLVYGAKSNISDVNQYRYLLFCAKKGEVESFQLPPCSDTLLKQALRSCHQAGIWKRSLQANPLIPNPVTMGWALEECDGIESLTIDWMDGQPAPLAVMELLSCKCTRSCKAPDCQCISNGLFCTENCKLNTCTNQPPEEEELLVDDQDDDIEF